MMPHRFFNIRLIDKVKVMKNILYSAFLLAAGIFFVSCQKELNFDLNGISKGTLKADSATNCLPSTVNGVYKADSTLGAENYIDVQVDVDLTGAYIISSDTVNGYVFKGTGNFGNTGLNTVRLYGSGKPLLQGVNTFIVRYDSSFCLIDVNVIAGNAPPDAVYTFGGAGGTCTGSSSSGTYMASLPTTATNTVTVSVTVTSPGAYSISTTALNGVSFSGTGTFTTASTTATLTATGTPLAAGTFNYPVTGSGSTCSFSVTYVASAGPATFTLGGAPASCTGAVIGGNYVAGTPANTSNTATININVTNAGICSVSSPVVNGVSFSGSALFTTTGPQTLVLYASGTGSAPGSFNFPLTGSGSTCTVAIPFSGAPTDFINCKIDGVYTEFNVNATAGLDNGTGFPILSIDGSTLSTSTNPSISLGITKLSGGSITAGTFTVNQILGGILVNADYFDAASTNFFMGSDPLNQSQNPAFTITISSITGTRVVGTFSGPVKENNGQGPAGKNITEGLFNVPIQ